MSLWTDLVSAALVGTDRRAAPSAPADSPLAMPLAGEPGPRRLLDLAAAVTLTRRAGVQPRSAVALPDPAPAETRVVVNRSASARLVFLLDSQPRGQQGQQQRSDLLTEWLSLAAAHRALVPPALLPRLLDAARERTQWRRLVRAVGGRRAVWLAEYNPSWSWLLEQSPEPDVVPDVSLWHEGTTAQRLSYLAGLRAHDPDRARDLLVETLPHEPPADRAALLSTLEHGLSTADEVLLEPALDDRRKEVRAVAAALLAAMANSAYQRRMAARALACVVPNSSGELVITPPAECDTAMRRDGIEPKPPQGTGERAWWFEQIVGRTHLSTWRQLEPDIAALLRSPVADGWRIVLHRGWLQATVDQHDGGWASAFVRGHSPAMARVQSPALALVQSVYRGLGPADAVDIAITMLDADDTYAEFVLPTCPRPWPPHLVAAAMARLRRFTERPGYMLSTLVSQAAAGFPIEQAAAVRALAESNRVEHGDDTHAPFFDRLAETLTLRHQMHQEFQ